MFFAYRPLVKGKKKPRKQRDKHTEHMDAVAPPADAVEKIEVPEPTSQPEAVSDGASDVPKEPSALPALLKWVVVACVVSFAIALAAVAFLSS